MFSRPLATINALILTVFIAAYLSSCVPARQFDDLKKKDQDCRRKTAN